MTTTLLNVCAVAVPLIDCAPAPLKVTVPPCPLKVPPLLVQFPAILIAKLLPEASSVAPELMVIAPSIVTAAPNVTVWPELTLTDMLFNPDPFSSDPVVLLLPVYTTL